MHRMTRASRVVTALTLALVLSGREARAQTPEERGLEIATEADRRESGFGDFTAEMEMILRNQNGDESRRTLRLKVLEVPGDGDKSLVMFDSPRDIAGTAFLTHSHPIESDDQWLYLPALRRIKRIATNNKSGPFMGSEFAYEDISSQEVEKYTYRFLREEVVDGTPAFVIERIPRYAHSGYTRQVVWLDAAEYRVLRIDYYDRKDDLLKTYRADEYRQYLGGLWRAHRMEMVNHQTGKSTIIVWSDFRFKNGFTPADFEQRSLRTAK